MVSFPSSTATPTIRRATNTNDLGASSREPKRQRATPSPQPTTLPISRTSSAASVSSTSSAFAPEPRRRPIRHRHGKHSASRSSSASNPEWEDQAALPLHVQTSPIHVYRTNDLDALLDSPPRGRGMSVPVSQLQNKLSNVSLGKTRSTPPLAGETSPEAMTRTPASSCPPSVDTPPPPTATPQRPSGGILRRNTPAPLTAIYDPRCPSATPMPTTSSLLSLGSPFASKSVLLPDDPESPTFPRPRSQSDWAPADALPDLHVSGGLSQRRYSNPDETGSCTSASSLFSSERHLPQQSPRTSVVNVWDDSSPSGGNDDGVSLKVNRPPYSGLPRSHEQFWNPRLLQSSPGPTSPLLGKSLAPSPTGSRPISPLPFPLPRAESASSTTALENERISSPTRSGRVTMSKGRSWMVSERREDDNLSIPLPEALPRRTSDPSHPSDPFATFVAQCNATRETQSDMAHHNPSSSPPSSDFNELDTTPSRGASSRPNTTLPPRPAHYTMKSRSSRLQFPSNAECTPSSTPPKRTDSFLPARPRLLKRATMPEVPTTKATPISRLKLNAWGDDKPSPAAFESSGINKKRGEKHRPRTSLPMPQFTPKWSPMPKTAPRTEQRPGRSTLSHSLVNPQTRVGMPDASNNDDTREELSQEFEFDDTDQEDMSPIRPMRSSLRRSVDMHHRRVSSTTSDIMTSPARRQSRGHARMSSSASSIGGSRGLRRKCSSLFSGASDGEVPSPATPTKTIPLASIQPKHGMTTPSPTPATTRYPFVRRLSLASVVSVDTISPTATPLVPGPIRTLSTGGPLARASNPMLAATYRAQGGIPGTPAFESQIGDTYIPQEAREAGAGRYERDFATIQALGQGEFSSVWKVRSKVDDTLWAVKKGKPYSGFRDRQRQVEEVAILRAIGKDQHPNIVRLADAWEEAGRLHIRTELAPCGDLAHYLASIASCGGMDEGLVWKMLAELTSALHHIHSHGVLHLDFKPSNILITNEGSLKVADFGLSVFAIPPQINNDFGYGVLAIGGDGDRSLGPSPVSDHEGDREYLCPEALNDVPPAPPADVYSLGIMTLEAALSVELPSNGEAWIKLRHDDFSDLVNQFAVRGGAMPEAIPGEPPTPVISLELISAIKSMMTSNPAQRMTLGEVLTLGPLWRAQDAMARGREEGGELRGRTAGPALADEDEEWTAYVLGEML